MSKAPPRPGRKAPRAGAPPQSAQETFKNTDKPGPRPATAPRSRLADQTRKLLGKHYAAKYGKKRGG